MIKNILISLFILLLASCASVGTKSQDRKNGENSSQSSQKASEDAQDVKGLDLSYSEGFIRNGKRSRYSCTKHNDFKVEEWKKHLESAYSCIQDQNWQELTNISDKLSHNHLKAPWGAYFKSILALDRFRDAHKALWMINLALKKAPDHAMLNYQKARVLWKLGEHYLAYDLMSKVLEQDAENSEAAFFLATIHYRDRDFEKALSFLDQVDGDLEKELSYLVMTGESLFHTQKFKKAITAYKRAISKNKQNAEFYYKVGLSYKALKKWKKSLTYLLKGKTQLKSGHSLASLQLQDLNTEIDYVSKKVKEEEMKAESAGQPVTEGVKKNETK